MQILALDLGTDTLSAVALGGEPALVDADTLGPAAGRLLDRRVAWRAFAVLGPVEAAAEMLAFAVAGGLHAHDLAAARGAAFATVVVAQTAIAWACRSDRDAPWQMGWGGNRLLVAAAVVELLIAAVCLAVVPVADALEHAMAPATAWPVIVGGVLWHCCSPTGWTRGCFLRRG